MTERPAPAKEEDPGKGALKWMRKHLGDRYEILRFVARGGMGAVYKARQKQPSRLVALKMMLGSAFASSRQRKRFEREAQAVARLNHPAWCGISQPTTWPFALRRHTWDTP